ncbi:MAG: hypothetical protein ACO1OB_16635 [Archangium sp.]
MNYDRLVVGYHGCDVEVAERLFAGASFKPSQNDFDWLGTGIYFWEYGLDRALQFANDQQARGKVKTPAVVGALLQLGKCFDLMDTRFTSTLARVHAPWLESVSARGSALPKNEGATDDLLLRRLDCAVINFCIDAMTLEGVHYDTVRCGFVEGPAVFPGSRITTKSHVQIAVRSVSCIVGVFRPRISL